SHPPGRVVFPREPRSPRGRSAVFSAPEMRPNGRSVIGSGDPADASAPGPIRPLAPVQTTSGCRLALALSMEIRKYLTPSMMERQELIPSAASIFARNNPKGPDQPKCPSAPPAAKRIGARYQPFISVG